MLQYIRDILHSILDGWREPTRDERVTLRAWLAEPSSAPAPAIQPPHDASETAQERLDITLSPANVAAMDEPFPHPSAGNPHYTF